MDSMIREWTVFLDRCLAQRVLADVFEAATVQLYQRSPLPGRKLVALLLKPRSPNAISVDPRVVTYLERLLALKKVDASDVLSATFHYSKDRSPKTGDDSLEKQPRWCNSPDLEELVCHRLQRAFATEERPVNNTEGLQTLIVTTRWMQAMVTSHTSDTMMQAMTGISQHPQQHSINVREALGVLVVGLIENSKILMILNHPTAKGGRPIEILCTGLRLLQLDLRKRLARSLSSFIPFLSHNSLGSPSSLEIANRLEMSQKQHELYEKPATVEGVQNENAHLEVAALQLDAVMNLPLVSTRAGLYVFLNSLVCPTAPYLRSANTVTACCSSAYRRVYDYQLFAF
jgi:mediator of RNA polymerase II transcription subunit 5